MKKVTGDTHEPDSGIRLEEEGEMIISYSDFKIGKQPEFWKVSFDVQTFSGEIFIISIINFDFSLFRSANSN